MHCILQCTGALHTAHANPCSDGVCVRHICGAKNVLIRFVSLGQVEYNGCNFYQVLRVCFDADIKFQLFIVSSFVSDLGPGQHGLMTDFIQLKIHSKFRLWGHQVNTLSEKGVLWINSHKPTISFCCNILIKAWQFRSWRMKVVNNVSTKRLHTFPVTKSRRYKVLDGKMMETEEMIIVPQLQSNKKY